MTQAATAPSSRSARKAAGESKPASTRKWWALSPTLRISMGLVSMLTDAG